MFAITATALLATIGLLYSFGFVLSERRMLQSAADAASLSGSWQILTELQTTDRLDATVRGAVERYAARNGVTDPDDVSGEYVDGTGASTGTALKCGCTFPPQTRGVRVTLRGQAPTLLPGLVGALGVLVQTNATAVARPTASPSSARLVVPVGVFVADYTALGQMDLASSRTRKLDLGSAGATNYGPPMSTNLQYWSDGQHSTGTLVAGSDVATVNAAFDSIAAGLADNVRRQDLHDASGAAYAIVTIPILNGESGSSVHVAGFARLKIKASDIASISARGTFVPYPADAFGVPTTGSPDFGASLVGIVS
jgi:hypothetical protein